MIGHDHRKPRLPPDRAEPEQAQNSPAANAVTDTSVGFIRGIYPHLFCCLKIVHPDTGIKTSPLLAVLSSRAGQTV